MTARLNHHDDNISSMRHHPSCDRTDLKDIPNVLAFHGRLENIISKRLSCEAHRGESWTYIPWSNYEFLNCLKVVNTDLLKQNGNDKIVKNLLNGKKFLDVGCGFGMKVWLANRQMMEATGLDLCSGYVKMAKEIFKNEGSINIIKANALRFKAYGDFDVVYMYQPIREERKMALLVHRVMKQMKKDAYLVAKLFNIDVEGMTKVDCHVWRK